MMKKLFIILIMLLFAASSLALSVGNSGINFEHGLNVGGEGISISKFISSVSPSSVSKEGGTNATKEDGTDWLKEG